MIATANRKDVNRTLPLLEQISLELQLPQERIKRTLDLLDEGNTVPFIARYRKEMTGALDEEQIRRIMMRATYLRELERRKEEVLRLIDEQGKLTPELAEAIRAAETLQAVEDLYRPYRPKRRTRASKAREAGLEPLAQLLLDPPAEATEEWIEQQAGGFADPQGEYPDAEAALGGARDIIAEQLADDAQVRGAVRELARRDGVIRTLKGGEEGEKSEVYSPYFDFVESVSSLPPHRVLAINRGEKEGHLRVKVEFPVRRAEFTMCDLGLPREFHPAAEKQLRLAASDGLERLLGPAVERDIRRELTEQAEAQSTEIFKVNLRRLLMQPPTRDRTVLGLDPAYRTGCKVAVVDDTGAVLATDTIYPTPPVNDYPGSAAVLFTLVNDFRVGAVAIGNGTACRETEAFVARFIEDHQLDLPYLIVNEAGASVYSASSIAREELPDLDVSLRGAVSIARRLQDPLAELVKIDPRSIGVGQYQHDVDQNALTAALDGVVEDVVNVVGVNLNTASPSLLRHVAGITTSLARKVVTYREEHGKFPSRQELLAVSGLGPVTYTQCAGFLRVPDGADPLDNTGVHPESYPAARELLARWGLEPHQLGEPVRRKAAELDKPALAALAEALGVGLPTLRDIIASLSRPGLDPREELPPPLFRKDITRLADLRPGMTLQGTVRNVVDFGAFVDIGVGKDGLLHVSQMADRYVKHPTEVVAVGDVLTLTVLDVDEARGRISLSAKRGAKKEA